MNIRTLTTLTLTATVALVLSACDRGKSRTQTAATPGASKPAPQQLDECPSADGIWEMNGGTSVEFGRKEGFLTLKQVELTEPVVMDGKTHKIKEISSGLEIEVTGSCKDRLVQITQKQGKVSISQIWYIAVNDGSLWLDETDGENTTQMTGKRQAPRQVEAQASQSPDGV